MPVGMFAWLQTQPPAPEAAPPPPPPPRLVNLTGKPLHFCRQFDDDNTRLRVVKTIESSGPVPTIEWAINEPDDAVLVSIDESESALPIFRASGGAGHFVVRNLRPESAKNLYLVDREILKVALKQQEHKSRRDLICAMPVSYKHVHEGVKGEAYWCGIRGNLKHASYSSDDSDDSDE
jgi:hypothetical protein